VRLGIKTEAGGIWYGGDFPFYNVSFFDPDDETGAMGMGLSNVYVSSESGEVLGSYRPWHGTGADVFVQLQLPLHSGRILGTFGRVLISVVGVMVAMLSITGVIIWWKNAVPGERPWQLPPPETTKPPCGGFVHCALRGSGKAAQSFFRHSLMKALRSSPFLPAASALQLFMRSC
jgi:uncharacterized iron-regulated membrane protein